MATFKETREILLASYASNLITIEEYALLVEENTSNNLDFPYYNYPPFDLESQSEAECRANFRVEKHHIPLVEDVLQIPQYFVCDQGTVCEGTEGLCMFLKRYSFPCRYSDMTPIFGRPVPELCMICNTVTDWIYSHHSQRITQWNRTILNPPELENYAEAVYNKGAGATKQLLWFRRWNCGPNYSTWGKPTTAIQRAQTRTWIEISVRGPTKWVNFTLVWSSR